ncbi:hypothetical protein EC988_007270 [Linderina pennispora]|nr:hypothetical protein EC988_007270 [Linderina pennispora]
MSTTGHDASAYIRNASTSHPIHILRLWIDIAPSATPPELDNDSGVNLVDRPYSPQKHTAGFSDFSHSLRYITDSDKRNCLLTLLHPRNYWPQYGNTTQIFGPVDTASRQSLATSYLSQSMSALARPSYYVPDASLSAAGSYEWSVDTHMPMRACAEPLLVDEDVFVSVCFLDAGQAVTYVPLDSFDRHRNAASGKRRRVWIQNVIMDLKRDSTENAGRLVINGDTTSRMRPGDSAYVRKLAPTESLHIFNCGRSGIEFIIVETPY